jgi:hypothetical protein
VTHIAAQAVALAINSAFGGVGLDLHVHPIACAGPVCTARASVATSTYVLDTGAEETIIGRCTLSAYIKGPRAGEVALELESCRPIEKSSIVVISARRGGL